MAIMNFQPDQQINPRSGFCAETKTFHSLRPRVTLPSPTHSLSVTDYIFHLSSATLPSTPFLIDSPTGHVVTYSDFIQRSKNLASNLHRSYPNLSKNDVAFILSPTSLELPLLYYSLLSLGVTVCPTNPLATPSELTHMIQLTKPIIAFATSSISNKLPDLPLGTIILDSPEFQSMSKSNQSEKKLEIKVEQSDRAAILFSSGTTGRVKGVELTHGNFIAALAGIYHVRRREENPVHPVLLLFIPMFHSFGFAMVLITAAMGETVVLMERFNFEAMLAAVERYKVTYIPVLPPLVVAMAKSELAGKYELGSLRFLQCGGAPLGKEVVESFTDRYYGVEIVQGYGLTEAGGPPIRMVDPEETERYGSVGKLSENLEAKIVDPTSGEALPPNQRGELWLRGPIVMRGYVGDDEATAATLDKDGWLKTGDLCFFDSDGFLYVVDRLKELIKYKAYQVAPAELEHLLQGHPDIADVAVVPYPDEEAGQIPMAFIVRKPESKITAAQVMDIIAKQVSPYKKVRRVAFINAIPKSPAGKIIRRELAKQAVSAVSSKL